jgi:hypothetical protein
VVQSKADCSLIGFVDSAHRSMRGSVWCVIPDDGLVMRTRTGKLPLAFLFLETYNLIDLALPRSAGPFREFPGARTTTPGGFDPGKAGGMVTAA